MFSGTQLAREMIERIPLQSLKTGRREKGDYSPCAMFSAVEWRFWGNENHRDVAKTQTVIERMSLLLFELHSTVSDSDRRDKLW